jgi:hypothetical protein
MDVDKLKDKLKHAAHAASTIIMHPQTTEAAGLIGVLYAQPESNKAGFSGHLNGQKDAYRHILWAAQVRRSGGLMDKNTNPDELDQITRDVLKIHEDSGDIRGQDKDSEDMDMYNNDIGIILGRQAFEEEWSADQLKQKVYDAVKNADGTGKNNTPFWYDKTNDPDRIPPKAENSKPPTLREELEKNFKEAKDKPHPNDAPSPDEIDPGTGKKFGELGIGQYAGALYRWKQAKMQSAAANQNATNDNGGDVQVRAYDRDGGKVHVNSYTRHKPQT